MVKGLRIRFAADDHSHVRGKYFGKPERKAVGVVLFVLKAIYALEHHDDQLVIVNILSTLNNELYLLVAHMQPKRKILP